MADYELDLTQQMLQAQYDYLDKLAGELYNENTSGWLSIEEFTKLEQEYNMLRASLIDSHFKALSDQVTNSRRLAEINKHIDKIARRLETLDCGKAYARSMGTGRPRIRLHADYSRQSYQLSTKTVHTWKTRKRLMPSDVALTFTIDRWAPPPRSPELDARVRKQHASLMAGVHNLRHDTAQEGDKLCATLMAWLEELIESHPQHTELANHYQYQLGYARYQAIDNFKEFDNLIRAVILYMVRWDSYYAGESEDGEA